MGSGPHCDYSTSEIGQGMYLARLRLPAGVAEQVDAPGLGPGPFGDGSSSLPARTLAPARTLRWHTRPHAPLALSPSRWDLALGPHAPTLSLPLSRSRQRAALAPHAGTSRWQFVLRERVAHCTTPKVSRCDTNVAVSVPSDLDSQSASYQRNRRLDERIVRNLGLKDS